MKPLAASSWMEDALPEHVFERLWGGYRDWRRSGPRLLGLNPEWEGCLTTGHMGDRPFFERRGKTAVLRVYDDEITVTWPVLRLDRESLSAKVQSRTGKSLATGKKPKRK